MMRQTRAWWKRVGLMVFVGLSGSGQQGDSADLIPYGAGWRYLNPQSAAEAPDVVDANFSANWFKNNFNLNGPNVWQGPGAEPFARVDAGSTDNRIEAFTSTDADFVRAPGTLIPLPPSGQRATSYFRHDFTTTSATTGLAIEFLVDDGARFYLDGQEILSHQCCVGVPNGTAPPHTSRATVLGDERTYSFRPVLPGGTLPAGNHTLAVSVFQNVLSSNDMGFSMRLLDGFLYDPLVPLGETYRYFEGFAEPSTEPLAWAAVNFDDAAWETGAEGFGYDTDTATNALPLIKTTLEDMETSYSSLYLRKSFTVADPSKYGKLELTMDYDDGFVAYINGKEVTRSNVDGEIGAPVAVDALGISHESTNASGAPGETFTIDLANFPGLLTAGAGNVLAIHGLNTTLDSSDFLLAQISLAGLAADVIAGKPGDFDGNDLLDTADIDALAAAIRGGNGDAKFDVNQDGAVNETDRRHWIEVLKNTWIGDSNFDGVFGTQDFVFVFVAGQFEDAVPGNSTWASGDWNGDGDFGTQDFVLAFQTGGFEQGPKAGGINAVAAVPEPATWCYLIGGCLLLRWRRK